MCKLEQKKNVEMHTKKCTRTLLVSSSNAMARCRFPKCHFCLNVQLSTETAFFQLVPNTSIVVIHPGSCNLRLGLASDAFPHVLPHCIAYRHKSPGQQEHYEDRILPHTRSQVGYGGPWRVCTIFSFFFIQFASLKTNTTSVFRFSICHKKNDHKQTNLVFV